MRKFWIAVAIILVIATGIWFWHKESALPAGSTFPQASSSEVTAALGKRIQNGSTNVPANSSSSADPQDTLAARAASPPLAAPADEMPRLPPLTVLDNARVAIHNYNAQFGENPIGTNPEITAALRGKNPKQINFIRPDSGLRVNDRGEMVDAYGTPFFFHQLSGKEMEIRSAGHDRIMWTYDDLVTR